MTDDLRRLALAATPGPWKHGPLEWEVWNIDPNGAMDTRVAGTWLFPYDAAYIAALSPSTVIPLLDVVEAAHALIGVTTPVNVSGAEYQDRKIYYAMLRTALERLDR